jgi:hypothetical protein
MTIEEANNILGNYGKAKPEAARKAAKKGKLVSLVNKAKRERQAGAVTIINRGLFS